MPTDTVRGPDAIAPSVPVARPTASPTARAARRGRALGALLAVVGASVLVALAVTPYLSIASTSASPASGTVVASHAEDCNKEHATADSALYINQAEPAQNLSANGTITGNLEFAVVNFTTNDTAIQVWFPDTYFTFPTATSSFSMTISPQFVAITGAGWLSPSALTKTEKVTKALDFPKAGIARLSTEKVAVQTTVPYGQITIEFRWNWTIQQPGAATGVSDAFSVPDYKSGSKGNLPSIFFPAPYVSFLAGTPEDEFIGNNYTATLGGDVAGRYFFLEMENATGKVEQSVGETAPANVSTFNVTIVLLNYDHYLVPGPYLVHIHDVCGAILYNKVVHLSFIPLATVGFRLSPSTCGNLVFGGTSIPSGGSATFAPSITAYNFSDPVCHGYTFSNWSTTGSLHIDSAHTMLVSGNGTFEVNYKPT